VASASVGLYLLPFAAGNFAGPLLLGRFFDTLGRKIMISGTYILSGGLLAITAWLFDRGTLNATTQTAAWVIIFFFASAGASSAYLTVSEIFPMETRAMAIAFFYAIGTGVGGISGPVLTPQAPYRLWSPMPPVYAVSLIDIARDREVDEIVAALAGAGPLERRRLARLVRADLWGPGRFSSALRAAAVQGKVRRTGRGPVCARARCAGSR
jgi:MFS family permease